MVVRTLCHQPNWIVQPEGAHAGTLALDRRTLRGPGIGGLAWRLRLTACQPLGQLCLRGEVDASREPSLVHDQDVHTLVLIEPLIPGDDREVLPKGQEGVMLPHERWVRPGRPVLIPPCEDTP